MKAMRLLREKLLERWCIAGENVTLGYAACREDLLKGDENHGIMHTGDLARRDMDGCYFIIGSLKAFLEDFWITYRT